jgi:hypothetical protein
MSVGIRTVQLPITCHRYANPRGDTPIKLFCVMTEECVQILIMKMMLTLTGRQLHYRHLRLIGNKTVLLAQWPN